MPENMDQLKGRAKEGLGAATDNEKLEREGKIDRAKGKTKEVVDRAGDKIRDALDRH